MHSDTVNRLDRLRQFADELARDETPTSAVEAMVEAERLYAAIDRLEAAAARRVQAADAAGAPRADGYSSTTAWLRRSCSMLAGRAAERVMVARQLRRLPHTAARFVAGTIGYGAVKALAHVARNLDDDDTAAAEPVLLDIADEQGPDDVAVAGRQIHRLLDPDGRPGPATQFRRRWLSLHTRLDGMGSLTGLLDPELLAMLRAALEPLAKPAGDDDNRTVGQRYADALHAYLSSRHRTHMTVLVDLKTLTGGSEKPALLPDGSPLPAADARRLALNAGISRVIVGPDSLPLDVGREERIATAAQRRALEIRDRCCVVHGCDVPAASCEVDHVTPWALGGRTDLANLALVCPFHNRYKNRHPDRVEVTRRPSGTIAYRILRTRRHPRDDPPAAAA